MGGTNPTPCRHLAVKIILITRYKDSNILVQNFSRTCFDGSTRQYLTKYPHTQPKRKLRHMVSKSKEESHKKKTLCVGTHNEINITTHNSLRLIGESILVQNSPMAWQSHSKTAIPRTTLLRSEMLRLPVDFYHIHCIHSDMLTRKNILSVEINKLFNRIEITC